MAEVRTLPTLVTSPRTTRSTTAAVRLLPPSVSQHRGCFDKQDAHDRGKTGQTTAAPESSYVQWVRITLWQKSTWRLKMTFVGDQSHLVLSGGGGSFKPEFELGIKYCEQQVLF